MASPATAIAPQKKKVGRKPKLPEELRVQVGCRVRPDTFEFLQLYRRLIPPAEVGDNSFLAADGMASIGLAIDRLVDHMYTHNITSDSLFQQLTQDGMNEWEITCPHCKYEWDGLYPPGITTVRCPSCKDVVPIDIKHLESDGWVWHELDCMRCGHEWETLLHPDRKEANCPECAAKGIKSTIKLSAPPEPTPEPPPKPPPQPVEAAIQQAS